MSNKRIKGYGLVNDFERHHLLLKMYICYLQDGELFQFGGFTMRFVYDFNDSLNSYSSRILLVHSDGMSLMRKMEKDSLGNQEEMPFKEP